ncbi:CD99 antigen-like protein 2 [Sarcophilus harrisii]|nr:CD99 antigen-like protein 2 [Sarcophilus harrisii]
MLEVHRDQGWRKGFWAPAQPLKQQQSWKLLALLVPGHHGGLERAVEKSESPPRSPNGAPVRPGPAPSPTFGTRVRKGGGTSEWAAVLEASGTFHLGTPEVLESRERVCGTGHCCHPSDLQSLESAPLPSSGPPRLAPPTLEALPAPAVLQPRAACALIPCVRVCACAEGWFRRSGISSSRAACASPPPRRSVFLALPCPSAPPDPLGPPLSSVPRHLLSGNALRGLSALPSPSFHLSAPAAWRSIWRHSQSTGNPFLTWTLRWISVIKVTNNFGAGKSLEDGLGESKRKEFAKDLIFDQTGSLYARIERFKRGSGKPSQKSDFDLGDALGPQTTAKSSPKKTDFDLGDALDPRTNTKHTTKKTDSGFSDFDLSDALDDRNDRFDGGRGRSDLKPGEGLTDKDLEDIIEGGYKPDKGKGDGRYDSNDDPGTGTLTETGTIASIASALAMALIGAVSSYISYQQKKFCFNIQQGVNTDYVKGQSLEGVSTEEPQVKYSALQPQSAEKPPQETAKI